MSGKEALAEAVEACAKLLTVPDQRTASVTLDGSGSLDRQLINRLSDEIDRYAVRDQRLLLAMGRALPQIIELLGNVCDLISGLGRQVGVVTEDAEVLRQKANLLLQARDVIERIFYANGIDGGLVVHGASPVGSGPAGGEVASGGETPDAATSLSGRGAP